MINHVCAQCQQNLQIPDEYAGQLGTCPKCGATFTAPMMFAPQSPYNQGGAGQAIASLIFGILSFSCLNFLGALPAVVLGHISLSKIKRGLMPAHAWGMAVAGLVLGYLNLVVTFASIAILILFALLSAGAMPKLGSAEVSTCQNNLKQMGIVFKMFAGENKGFFPHLSATPGQLMASKDEIYPEYLTDPAVLVCPAAGDRATKQAQVDDESYFYLGYLVTDDREVESFCKAYREHEAKGLPFDNDLPVPMGEGTEGGDAILRLKEGIERRIIADTKEALATFKGQNVIPVLIERPGHHGARSGGSVLYMDGHVELIPYPGKWPMTPQTIGAIQELDAMGK